MEDPASRQATRIAVLVATRARPRLLENLLQALSEQELPDNCSMYVVVVDNDPVCTAKPVLEEMTRTGRLDLVTAHETAPGVVAVRNRGVRMATDASHVAFIDDDELPTSTWLARLLHALEHHGADVATGPVSARLPVSAPEWARTSGSYRQGRKTRASGTPMSYAATNNTLAKRAVFDAFADGFDPRYARTGGEDSHFFLRVSRAGFKIIWCAEAEVTEDVPADRLSRRWVIRRAFRIGSTRSRIEAEVMGLRAVPVRLVRAGWLVMRALRLLLPGGAPFSGRAVDALLLTAEAAGSVAGVLGITTRPYGSPAADRSSNATNAPAESQAR